MAKFLEKLFDISTHLFGDPDAKIAHKAVYTMFEDARFRLVPGSTEHHHIFDGGLMQHTYEVAEMCYRMGAVPEVDIIVLLTAALLHDYGKIFDYAKDANGIWQKTSYRAKIRHVAGSYHLAMNLLEGATEDFKNDVGHCILAHHGRQEWGSPVEPQTREAYILHAADMLSAHYGVTK